MCLEEEEEKLKIIFFCCNQFFSFQFMGGGWVGE